jgi:hypothetical protein
VARAFAAAIELLMRIPLHELEKPDFGRVGASKLIERRVIGSAPRLGPMPPGAFEPATENLEASKLE